MKRLFVLPPAALLAACAGYFLGIVCFGVGARKTRTITRDRIVRVAG